MVADRDGIVVITGEFPPAPGGVSDYSERWLSEVLTPGSGDPIVVLTRRAHATSGSHDPWRVQSVGSFGPIGVLRLIRHVLAARPALVVLHYVPHMYERRGVPVIMGIALVVLRVCRLRVLTVMHEMWSDGPGVRGRVVHHTQRLVVRMLVWASAHVVVTLRSRFDELLALAPGAAGRVSVIPVSPTLPLVPTPSSVLEAPVRLLHFGARHPSKDTERVRRALDELDRRGISYQVRVVGTTQVDDARCTVLGFCSSAQLAQEIAQADLVVLPFVDGASARRTTLANCLSAGKATVSTVGRDTDVTWFGDALVLVDGTADEYARAVARLASSSSARARQAAAARLWAPRSVDWAVTAPKWRALVTGMTTSEEQMPSRSLRRARRMAANPRAAPRVALSLLRLTLAKFQPELATPVVRFRHTQVIADLRTSLGLHHYRYGHTDPDHDLLATLIRPGSVMVDCGANTGLFSISALGAGASRAYAFEPASSTRRRLEANLAAAGAHDVVVLPFALSDIAGTATFTVMPDMGGLSSFAPADPTAGVVEQVQVRRLDDVLPRELWSSVSVVKVDVEGAEARLLDGAVELLNHARPAVIIEIEEAHLARQGSSAEEVRTRLREMGYRFEPGAKTPNELYVLQ